MAKRTTIILIDDLDQTESDDIETVKFGFDGKHYEIDLNDNNRIELQNMLQKYIDAATLDRQAVMGSISSGSPARRKYGSGPVRRDTKDIREWLRGQGIEIGDRGRIPKEYMARWEDSTGGERQPRRTAADVAAEQQARAAARQGTSQSAQPALQAAQNTPPPVGNPKAIDLPETADEASGEPSDADLIAVYNDTINKGKKAATKLSAPQRRNAEQYWEARQAAKKTAVSA